MVTVKSNLSQRALREIGFHIYTSVIHEPRVVWARMVGEGTYYRCRQRSAAPDTWGLCFAASPGYR